MKSNMIRIPELYVPGFFCISEHLRGGKMIKILFAILLMQTAVHDLKYKRIPDCYPLGILLLAIFSTLPIVDKGFGALVISLPMLIIAVLKPGSIGGGDIKLIFAGGAFLGIAGIVESVVAAILICGVYCLWLLLIKKKSGKTKIAFGPFLCMGMLYTIL